MKIRFLFQKMSAHCKTASPRLYRISSQFRTPPSPAKTKYGRRVKKSLVASCRLAGVIRTQTTRDSLRFCRVPRHPWYGPSMRRYDLSRHAKDVISERYIRLAWLEQVLDSPDLVEVDRTDPELMHHVGRIKEHGNR